MALLCACVFRAHVGAPSLLLAQAADDGRGSGEGGGAPRPRGPRLVDEIARLPSAATAGPGVQRHVEMLTCWIRGHLDWAHEICRYCRIDEQALLLANIRAAWPTSEFTVAMYKDTADAPGISFFTPLQDLTSDVFAVRKQLRSGFSPQDRSPHRKQFLRCDFINR